MSCWMIQYLIKGKVYIIVDDENNVHIYKKYSCMIMKIIHLIQFYYDMYSNPNTTLNTPHTHGGSNNMSLPNKAPNQFLKIKVLRIFYGENCSSDTMLQ